MKILWKGKENDVRFVYGIVWMMVAAAMTTPVDSGHSNGERIVFADFIYFDYFKRCRVDGLVVDANSLCTDVKLR